MISGPATDVAAENKARFAAYLAQIDQHIAAYDGINPFWAGLYEEFRKAGLRDPDTLVAQINAAPKTNYLVAPLTPAAFDDLWRALIADMAVVRDDPRARDLPKREVRERAYVACYLEEVGRLEDARRMLREARLAPGYVNLRHTYYAGQILDALSEGPVDALEIGAGGSSLKILLASLLGERLASYTIVDLPEMLCISISAALSFFPEEKLVIGVGDARHVFVPAADAPALAASSARYNLAINTHSFQEMDDSVIAGYFDQIYRQAGPGALFFNTNWRQAGMFRLDGSIYDNDPANYPYRATDEVLYAGVDPLMETLKTRFGMKTRTENRTSIRRIG